MSTRPNTRGTGIAKQRKRTKPLPPGLEVSPALQKLFNQNSASRVTYGLYDEETAFKYSQAQIEMHAFYHNPSDGLGRLEHFKNFAFATWVGLKDSWNPWCDRMVSSLCRETDLLRVNRKIIRATAWTGAAGSGKTFISGLYALVWWLAQPSESIAILTSTSKVMLRRRVWSVIREKMDTMVDVNSMTRLKTPYPVQESQTMIQASAGDDKHAIFALAVAHGETAKAISFMSGLHAKRMLLIVDECDGTPEGIMHTIPNMQKACEDFTCLFIANPKSHLDAHGRLCEPLGGWGSINVDHDTWLTKGVPEWQVPRGVAEHFDGFRSPNVVEGWTKYPHIYSLEDYRLATGDEDRQRHIGFWAQDRGFWPGEGVANTIFTESMLERCGGYEQVEWRSEPTNLAFLDPAFGGDECVLVFGKAGFTTTGKHVLLVTEKLTLDPIGSKEKEAEYAIAEQMQAACLQRGVAPRCAGVDSNGTGRGAAAVLATLWSPQVQKFDSCGPVSDLPVSSDDPTPCSEVYDRAVTEHWFLARLMLQSGQLKGIYQAAAIQFCTREYERVSKKYRLSTKVECKEMMGRSPDDADAVVGLCRLAVEVCGLYPRSTARELPEGQLEGFQDPLLAWMQNPEGASDAPMYSGPLRPVGLYSKP